MCAEGVGFFNGPLFPHADSASALIIASNMKIIDILRMGLIVRSTMISGAYYVGPGGPVQVDFVS